MKSVFADAYYYIALLNPRDAAHRRAVDLTTRLEPPIWTTEWVLMEVADGLSRSHLRQMFIDFYNFLRNDGRFTIVRSDSRLFEHGFDLYSARTDKSWSLTDCISFVVMEREGITEALTGDRHFEQAGFRILL
jgi:predicted nucleic acid-binding protein